MAKGKKAPGIWQPVYAQPTKKESGGGGVGYQTPGMVSKLTITPLASPGRPLGPGGVAAPGTFGGIVPAAPAAKPAAPTSRIDIFPKPTGIVQKIIAAVAAKQEQARVATQVSQAVPGRIPTPAANRRIEAAQQAIAQKRLADAISAPVVTGYRTRQAEIPSQERLGYIKKVRQYEKTAEEKIASIEKMDKRLEIKRATLDLTSQKAVDEFNRDVAERNKEARNVEAGLKWYVGYLGKEQERVSKLPPSPIGYMGAIPEEALKPQEQYTNILPLAPGEKAHDIFSLPVERLYQVIPGITKSSIEMGKFFSKPFEKYPSAAVAAGGIGTSMGIMAESSGLGTVGRFAGFGTEQGLKNAMQLIGVSPEQEYFKFYPGAPTARAIESTFGTFGLAKTEWEKGKGYAVSFGRHEVASAADLAMYVVVPYFAGEFFAAKAAKKITAKEAKALIYQEQLGPYIYSEAEVIQPYTKKGLFGETYRLTGARAEFVSKIIGEAETPTLGARGAGKKTPYPKLMIESGMEAPFRFHYEQLQEPAPKAGALMVKEFPITEPMPSFKAKRVQGAAEKFMKSQVPAEYFGGKEYMTGGRIETFDIKAKKPKAMLPETVRGDAYRAAFEKDFAKFAGEKPKVSLYQSWSVAQQLPIGVRGFEKWNKAAVKSVAEMRKLLPTRKSLMAPLKAGEFTGRGTLVPKDYFKKWGKGMQGLESVSFEAGKISGHEFGVTVPAKGKATTQYSKIKGAYLAGPKATYIELKQPTKMKGLVFPLEKKAGRLGPEVIDLGGRRPSGLKYLEGADLRLGYRPLLKGPTSGELLAKEWNRGMTELYGKEEFARLTKEARATSAAQALRVTGAQVQIPKQMQFPKSFQKYAPIVGKAGMVSLQETKPLTAQKIKPELKLKKEVAPIAGLKQLSESFGKAISPARGIIAVAAAAAKQKYRPATFARTLLMPAAAQKAGAAQAFATFQAPKAAILPATAITPATAARTKAAERTIEREMAKVATFQAYGRQFRPPRITPRFQPPRIPVGGLPSAIIPKEAMISAKPEQGYNVYARNKETKKGGRFVKVNSRMQTLESALSLGGTAADETVSRTFEVRPGGRGRPASDYGGWGILSGKFREQIRRGQRMQFPSPRQRWVEKSAFAIDTPGEFQGITVQGWLAQKRAKAGRGFWSRGRPMKMRRPQRGEIDPLDILLGKKHLKLGFGLLNFPFRT